jgi:hypothetical protein
MEATAKSAVETSTGVKRHPILQGPSKWDYFESHGYRKAAASPITVSFYINREFGQSAITLCIVGSIWNRRRDLVSKSYVLEECWSFLGYYTKPYSNEIGWVIGSYSTTNRTNKDNNWLEFVDVDTVNAIRQIFRIEDSVELKY